jgi:hypothetical protein
MLSSLLEARKEGYVPFTHAALYVYVGIGFDIVGRFVNETKADVLLTYYDFDSFEIINLPQPFGSRLYLMNDQAYPAFCSWLESVEMVHPKHGGFCKPRRLAAPVGDPFMRLIGVDRPRPEVIDVWTISTMNAQLGIETHVETVPYPIFKPGEAEELERDEFLKRLPHPTTAPESVKLVIRAADPIVVSQGHSRLAEMEVHRESSH